MEKNSKENNDIKNKIIADLETKFKQSKDEISLRLNDIIELKKIKSKLEIDIAEILSNNKEINSKYLKERDYNKTLEEKISDFEDKTV